jgi:hypothetical protein
MHRVKIYCWLLVGLGLIIFFVGSAMIISVPYTAADALAESIQGAHNTDEVRSRIVDYYRSVSMIHFLLFCGPGIAVLILAALGLKDIKQLSSN